MELISQEVTQELWHFVTSQRLKFLLHGYIAQGSVERPNWETGYILKEDLLNWPTRYSVGGQAMAVIMYETPRTQQLLS